MPSTSPETPNPVRPLSGPEREALAWLDVSLSSGATLLRPMIKRMLAEGLDAHRLYSSAVDARQYVMERNGYPPLRVPTWDEVNPDAHPSP
jgi:hypothetical protein